MQALAFWAVNAESRCNSSGIGCCAPPIRISGAVFCTPPFSELAATVS